MNPRHRKPNRPKHTADACQPQNRLARVALVAGQAALVAAIVAAPWLFGGVQARHQLLLVGLAIVAAVAWLVYAGANRGRIAALPLAALGLFVIAGLAAAQMLPLSESLLRTISPQAAELRAELQSEDNPSDAEMAAHLGLPAASTSHPASLYPASTRKDLAVLLAVAATLALGAAMFVGRTAPRWLCGALAVNGAALAFFALVQKLTFNGMLYWTVPLTQGGSPFGPYVNRNNAGGLLLICLAAALAAALWAFRRSGLLVSLGDGQRQAGNVGKLRAFLAHLDARTLAALSLAACIVAGILACLSRGAAAALVGASLVTAGTIFLARHRQTGLGWMGLTLLAGAGLVSWAGMSQSVADRLSTLWNLSDAADGRVALWNDSAQAIPEFWQTGSGLGTYRYVYELYQSQPARSWYYHAENVYLEALIELGAAGLAILLAIFAATAWASWRLVRRGPTDRYFALGVAGIFALSSQAIIGGSDFGLLLPANALTMALLCGSILGCARLTTAAAKPVTAKPLAAEASLSSRLSLAPVFASALAGVVLLVLLGWSVYQTARAASVENAMRAVDLLSDQDRKDAKKIGEAAERLALALAKRPDDAQGLCCLANLHVHLYRLAAFEQLDREMPAAVNRQTLWNGTLPSVVHGRAQQFAGLTSSGLLAKLRSEPVIDANLVPALKQLLLARRACPLLPQMHVAIAQLSVLASSPAANEIHLKRAARVAPAQPEVAYEAGLADLQAGRNQAALDHWRRYLTLSTRRQSEILRLVAHQCGPATVADVLPDDPQLLVRVVQKESVVKDQPALQKTLLDRAAGAIDPSDLPEAEKLFWAASVLELQENLSAAADRYEQAVQRAPHNHRWRYQLALVLQRQGRLDEAHAQAKTCARQDVDNRAYRQLLERINQSRTAPAAPLP